MSQILLLPVSLAPDEQPLVDKAREIALAHSYDILLLHVVDLYQVEVAMAGAELTADDMNAYKDQLIAQKEQTAQARLKAIARELEAAGLTVSFVVEAGRPGRRIMRAANQGNDIAHVVIGSRHTPSLERFLRGNIAAKLQRRAPCPVTVVQLPARAGRQST